jgi:hypothetical protein
VEVPKLSYYYSHTQISQETSASQHVNVPPQHLPTINQESSVPLEKLMNLQHACFEHVCWCGIGCTSLFVAQSLCEALPSPVHVDFPPSHASCAWPCTTSQTHTLAYVCGNSYAIIQWLFHAATHGEQSLNAKISHDEHHQIPSPSRAGKMCFMILLFQGWHCTIVEGMNTSLHEIALCCSSCCSERHGLASARPVHGLLPAT